jgi:hypothetical protein
MVRAALIIVTGWLDRYIFDGAAAEGKMASFELWDSLIRQSVAWVNQCVAIGEYADPMDAVIKAQANDPEKEELSDLLIALREKFGDSPFAAKDVITTFEFQKNSISEALSLIGNVKCQTSPKSLGKVLTFRQDKIVNGLCLKSATPMNNSCRWKVEALK